MRNTRRTLGLVLGLLLVSGPVLAQSLAVMRDIEERLLLRRIDAYREAHSAEQEAVARLQAEAQRLYVALGDRGVEVDTLRRQEAELSLLRETAMLRARQSTELRMDVYSRMERLDELDRELMRDGSTLYGTWTIDLGPEGTGIVKFYTYSGRVEATYELQNGGRGTLRGVLRGNLLELERIDAARGADRAFLGQISDDGNTIVGTWQGKELAQGEPSAGNWIARRE